jgi:tetratricopeptide (TPR) repeat protein
MLTGNTTALKQADKLVRDGNLKAALALIRKVRCDDPENQYALAYEERVRSLLGDSTDVETTQPEKVRAAGGKQASARVHPLAEIVGLFSDAYDALSRNDFRGALDTLGRARQLDPTNADIPVLEEQIQLACRAATPSPSPDCYHAIVRSTIDAYIEEATDCAGRGQFDDALHLIARGFVLDPGDSGLRECERLVQTSRALMQRQQEEAERASAFLAHVPEAPEVRLNTGAHHYERAKEQLAVGAFDDALTEVALGLIQDPESSALQALERDIWTIKAARSSSNATPRTSGESSHLIHLHLLAADEFARCADFTRALDSLAKAYVIDPTNVELKRAEVRIRQQELRHHQQTSAPALKLIYHNDRVANGE